MSENGNGMTTPKEVVATAVEHAVPAMPAVMPDPSVIKTMLEKLSPRDRETLFEIGRNFGQQMAVGPATAGRPAVESAPAAQVPPTDAAQPTAQAATPPAQAAPATSVDPGFPPAEPPPNYVHVPEAVYLWTAQGSESKPLWGLLAYGRKRTDVAPGRLVFKLLKPAYAYTRAGRRIVVPPGGWVMVTLTDSLEPFLQLADNKDGCVAMWIRALGEIPVDGGGIAYAYDVRFEPSAENPSQPRLYPRQLLAAKTA